MAKLYFYYGTMGSSKTANLLIQANSFEERGIPFICLKPSLDTRDGNYIKSRVGIQRECAFIETDTDLFKAIQTYDTILRANSSKHLQWVLIDESQFLLKNQIDDLAKVVDELNINVCCYGLRTDFKTQSFEGSKRLFELADDLIEIKSTCSCGRKTIVNARINNKGEIINDGEAIEIEGKTKYISICRKCYNNMIREKN